MEQKELFEKIKKQATAVAEVACEKSKEIYEISKINLKLFDLNTDLDSLYKDLGKLVFEGQRGAELGDFVIENKVNEITDKLVEINQIKAKKENIKNTIVCDNCDTIGAKEDDICGNCGFKL